MRTIKVGVIGCGNISGAYFGAAKRFPVIEVVACADLDPARARAKAQEFGIARALSVEELLADPEIEIAINLTIPLAHAEVALASLKAGKHAYAEKPFAVARAEGQRVVDLAAEKALLIGCAPDTFLGGGIQTARKLIDDGAIGKPVAAAAHMMCHGHESWHPDPEFYYKKGGGPMFDMGPYYLTALVNLLGPVSSVSGAATTTFTERLITSQPKSGTKVAVDVPTHITGIMQFAEGAVGTITTSFDVWSARLPCIEIYGTEGSLSVPDPNGFGGTVEIARPGAEWQSVPLTHGYTENNRGIGVADMACALQSGRPHRASGALAFHVLDIMESIHDSWDQRQWVDLGSTCAKPAALPVGLTPGELDP
jgi:predicted dehydrogenase